MYITYIPEDGSVLCILKFGQLVIKSESEDDTGKEFILLFHKSKDVVNSSKFLLDT